MPLPLSGNIKETSIVELLQDLHGRKASGTLSVRFGDMVKAVHLKEGRIVFATSSDPMDRLGEILVREGKLKREGLEHALRLSERAGGFKKLGAILVESGLVSPKDLFSGLKTQVKEIIYSLFLQQDARFSFEESLPADIIHLQLDMEELIMEIIQKIRQGA